jgi:hypothetical protein
MRGEATKVPVSEPRPPTTMTTKRIGPSIAAMDGCTTSAGPAMTPAMPQHRHHVGMGERGLDDEADAGAGQDEKEEPEHRNRVMSMNMR